jgi:hypothetical protein
VIKALIIVVVVVAALAGGIFVLRSTARTGMPSAEVLERAKRRARELAEAEKRDPDNDGQR